VKVLRTRTHMISTLTAGILLVVQSWTRYFVTGQSVLGRDTDNASFLHAATVDYRKKPVEKLTGPIWQRLARRWALIGVPVFALFLTALGWVVRGVYYLAPGRETTDLPWLFTVDWIRLSLWWELLALVAAVGWASRYSLGLLKDRHRTSEFVYPTWEAACQQLGLKYHRRDARKAVTLPDDFEPTDVQVVEPARHSWATRWAFDIRDRRRLARETAQIEAEEVAEAAAMAEASDVSAPEGVSTELVPAPKPGVLDRRIFRKAEKAEDTPAGRVEEQPVRIALPPGKCGSVNVQKNLLAAVGGVLGMPDPLAKWFLRGRHPYVELRPRRLPPAQVLFAGIKRHFEAADIDHPVIGLSAGNHVEVIDYENNSPHVMVSGGSGTGKSVLLKAILCQRMHHGAGLIMLDYKRVSHRWAHNLPGCIYAWRIEDIHNVAVRAGVELERRIETVLPEGDDTEVDLVDFRVIDIMVEEINSLTPQLVAYWAEIRDSDAPTASPAVAAIKRIVNMGREYRMHVHIGAQRASANVFGANGGDIRESFQTRLIAKWTVQTWKMLAQGLPFQRCPSGTRGIWARVQDDEVVIVRSPYLTNRQAREWAMSGVECPPTPLGELIPSGRPEGMRPADVRTDIAPRLVSLSAALPQLPGKPLSIEGMRTASKRPGFPVPIIIGAAPKPSLYDLDALIDWKLEREGFEQLVEQFDQPAADRRPGIVYAADVLDEATGAVVLGYVGQTRRSLAQREAEHRGDKPWADLIVGSFRVLWKGDPTDAELDDIERQKILELKPLYNIEHQRGAPHQVPLWDQRDQRYARDDAAGKRRWVPVDVYNGERRAEIVEGDDQVET
jgi:DNA translocase FtsK/SpoIIIE-like protein